MTEDNILGFLKAGRYRAKIISLLKKSCATPSEIANKLGVNLSQISRTLSELEKFELITCTTPNRHIGRIYRTTKKGVLALASLEGS